MGLSLKFAITNPQRNRFVGIVKHMGGECVEVGYKNHPTIHMYLPTLAVIVKALQSVSTNFTRSLDSIEVTI